MDLSGLHRQSSRFYILVLNMLTLVKTLVLLLFLSCVFSLRVCECPYELKNYTFAQKKLGSLALFGAGIYGLARNTRVLLESTFVSWTLVIMSVIILLVSLLGVSAGLSESKRIVGAVGKGRPADETTQEIKNPTFR